MPNSVHLELVPIGRGAIAVSHRPKLASLPALSTWSVTHVVTAALERVRPVPADGVGEQRLGRAQELAGLAAERMPASPDENP
jgi:hypothetical protein